MESAPSDPPVPPPAMAGYSGTPLPKKLGIKPRLRVAMSAAPDDFETTLGELPEGVQLKRSLRGKSDLVLWFVRAARDLETKIDRMGDAFEEGGGLWIIWPKQASGVQTDVSERLVREIGLVDYKICAVDQTWSGMKGARRKQ